MKRKESVLIWLDDRVWAKLLEPMLIGEPEQADDLARMWGYLLSELEDGPEGVHRARQCLENALRVTFHFSESNKRCRARYETAMTGSVNRSSR